MRLVDTRLLRTAGRSILHNFKKDWNKLCRNSPGFTLSGFDDTRSRGGSTTSNAGARAENEGIGRIGLGATTLTSLKYMGVWSSACVTDILMTGGMARRTAAVNVCFCPRAYSRI